ncbi:MAG: hypothetical protein K2X11_05865, partial [Acetobacteraceae bacterium]|nr:hypothetical protein [Acetobacteraceae bacterium]
TCLVRSTGVRAGSACEATLRAAGFAPLLSLSDTAALAEALRSGAIAAWCGEVPALRRVAARLDLPLLIGPPLGRVPLWLAAVDPNPDLAGRLTDAYGALQAEGMVEALLGSALAP